MAKSPRGGTTPEKRTSAKRKTAPAAQGTATVGAEKPGKANKAQIGKAQIGKTKIGKAQIGKTKIGKAKMGKIKMGQGKIGKGKSAQSAAPVPPDPVPVALPAAPQAKPAKPEAFPELHPPPAERDAPALRLSAKIYDRELARLHAELVKLQDWVVHKKLKICVVFEGRDSAGKGGTIKAITERVSPRVFRVVALPKPTERERTQMYLQRYIKQFPAGGEIVLFDRSWYNRAGVERVMGFCSDDEARRFLTQAPGMERAMVDSGIILIKYWLEVSADEQTRRLQARIDDPRKTWKLSPMDLESYRQWFAYSRARDEMFRATDTSWAPWFVALADDKRSARLNIIRHLLAQIPYKALPQGKVKLPKRKHDKHYVAPDYPYRFVPDHPWGADD